MLRSTRTVRFAGAAVIAGLLAAVAVPTVFAGAATSTETIVRLDPSAGTGDGGGSWWQYRAGADGIGDWKSLAYNDGAWAQNGSRLGFGGDGEQTVLPDANVTSYYFRKRVTITDPATIQSATVSMKFDDGAVVYVNGVEVKRLNMPAGTISAKTLASSYVNGTDEQKVTTFSIDPRRFVAGDRANVIAVEVHQAGPSSDLGFDLGLTVTKGASPTTTAATTTSTTAPATTTAPPPAATTTTAPPANGWTQVWADEFNGTAVDRSKWNIYTGTLDYDQACYTANEGPNGNLQVANGVLTIRTKYEPGKCADAYNKYERTDVPRPYTTGYLRTDATKNLADRYLISPASTRSGVIRMEFRGQFPTNTIKGIWPGFWSRNQTDGSLYGELDLIERWAMEPNNMTYKTTTHFGGRHTGGDTGYVTNRACPPDGRLMNNCEDITTSMHTWAVEVDTNLAEVRYYLDGRLTVRHNASSPAGSGTPLASDTAAWLTALKGQWDLRIMTQVITKSDPWSDEPTANFAGAEFKVDWVRVFVKN